MTVAVCLCCGAQKFGAWVECKQCSYAPLSGWELSVSVICSDQIIPLGQLRNLGADIQEHRRRKERRDWRFDEGADVYITRMFDDPSWRDMLTLVRGAKSGFLSKQMNWHFTGHDGYRSEVVTRGQEISRGEFNSMHKAAGEDAFFVKAYNAGEREASLVSKRRWYCAHDINTCVARRNERLTIQTAGLNWEALNFTVNYMRRKDGIDLRAAVGLSS